MEAAVILLCLLLVYAAHALGWIRGWAPAGRAVGFWGTLGGDLYEVRRAPSSTTKLEIVSNGKVRPAAIRPLRRLCPEGGACGELSLDGRTLYWRGAEKWVRQGV